MKWCKRSFSFVRCSWTRARHFEVRARPARAPWADDDLHFCSLSIGKSGTLSTHEDWKPQTPKLHTCIYEKEEWDGNWGGRGADGDGRTHDWTIGRANLDESITCMGWLRHMQWMLHETFPPTLTIMFVNRIRHLHYCNSVPQGVKPNWRHWSMHCALVDSM